MRLFKSIGMLVLLSPGVLMAQEVVISGKDFESGAGDAKIAEIARQAAASGKTVVVTTPPYWQDKAAAKLRSSSPDVHVKTSDAFFENVMIRVVANDKPDKPKPPETPPPVKPAEPPAVAVAKVTPRPEPKVVSASPAPAVKAPPVEPAPESTAAIAKPVEKPATPAPARVVLASNTPPPSAVSSPPAPVPAPVPATASAAPVVASITPMPSGAAPIAPVAPRSDANIADLRRKFESQLNLGKAAEGSIKPGQLQKGDEIFVRGPVRAVVRRFGSRVQLFWLEGALNVERAELTMKDAGHYSVNDSIRDVANPSLRALHLEPKIFASVVPGEKTATRTDMERHFNDAHPIYETLHPDQLQYGDLFYIYRNYGVVFRRTDQGFNRYWLEGSVDLNQAGIVHDGDAYRLVGDRL